MKGYRVLSVDPGAAPQTRKPEVSSVDAIAAPDIAATCEAGWPRARHLNDHHGNLLRVNTLRKRGADM